MSSGLFIIIIIIVVIIIIEFQTNLLREPFPHIFDQNQFSGCFVVFLVSANGGQLVMPNCKKVKRALSKENSETKLRFSHFYNLLILVTEVICTGIFYGILKQQNARIILT